MKYYTRHVKKFLAGDMIFTENSACDGMYIIDSGRVRIYKTVISKGESNEIDLCELGAKAMFGEMAMIDEDKRSANVQAIEPTSCTIITKSIFEDQFSKIPPWMVNMIKILVSRLRDTNEKMRTIIEEHTSVDLNQSTEMATVGLGIDSTKNISEDGTITQTKSDEIIDSLFENSSGS